MKTTTLLTALLTTISPALSATIPVPAARDIAPVHDVSADGLYRIIVDSEGNTQQTEFTPYDEIANLTSSNSIPGSGSGYGSGLEKRREDCGPGSVNVNDADEANKCLLDAFNPGDVHLNKHAWTYCVRRDVVSFICPYSSNGYKPRDAIQATMYHVKQKCGPSKMGYAQVSYGLRAQER
ncbi:hypothetical protein B0H65DRAFT_442012 [Neurospora tetraspora]|uniref:Uncharacterized protein n=1 Tax=Neurospora tetraspora TaxID=94610 RepID=A0AAE0JIH9_9PEZI|nr:hypothetical protein B0H65DRAFT_442012 [Neurospora tetraspora]